MPDPEVIAVEGCLSFVCGTAALMAMGAALAFVVTVLIGEPRPVAAGAAVGLGLVAGAASLGLRRIERR
jgi:VIT1/CCC1 family predicted Fe2+/Mn2+ transporter